MDEQDRKLDRILSERLLAELQTVREFVQDIPEINERLTGVEDRLGNVEGELRVHGEILREHSADLREIKTILGGQMETMTELKLASHMH